MLWFYFQGVRRLVFVVVIQSFLLATFLQSVNCGLSSHSLKIVGESEWKNDTISSESSQKVDLINPNFTTINKNQLLIQPTFSDTKSNRLSQTKVTTKKPIQRKYKRLQKANQTNAIKIKSHERSSIPTKIDRERNTTNSHQRLNFHASPLLSVGVETTSSFQNGIGSMENLIKHGYPHHPLFGPKWFQPNKYQLVPWDYKSQKNFNSFNIIDPSLETEYNAEALRPKSRNIFQKIKKSDSTKYTSESRQTSQVSYKSRETKTLTKSKSENVLLKNEGVASTARSERQNHDKHGSLNPNDDKNTPPPNDSLAHFRYFYAHPPDEGKPQITVSEKGHSHSSKDPLNVHNISESPNPSEIAGLVVVQLHSRGQPSSQLSSDMSKQQLLTQTRNEKNHANNKDSIHQSQPQEQQNTNNHYPCLVVPQHRPPGIESHSDSYKSHTHSIPHSHQTHSSHNHHHHSEEDEEKEDMEFQEGRITISKVMLGSKSLKKGTGIVVLASVIVTLIVAGLTAISGASIHPILFPLILLPIAILAFLLFIPSILLFVPIVIAGLAGGQERKRRRIDDRLQEDKWRQFFDPQEVEEENMNRLFDKIPRQTKYLRS